MCEVLKKTQKNCTKTIADLLTYCHSFNSNEYLALLESERLQIADSKIRIKLLNHAEPLVTMFVLAEWE